MSRLLPVAHLSEPTKKSLLAHPWKGNIRELQNTIERATFFVKDSRRPVLKPEHLGLSTTPHLSKNASLIPEDILPKNKEDVSAENRQNAIDWIERLYLERALKVIGKNTALYSLLGVSKTFYYERKKQLFADRENTEGAET